MQPEVSACSQGWDHLQATKCPEPNQRTPPGSPSTSCWDAHAPGPRVIVTLRGPWSSSRSRVIVSIFNPYLPGTNHVPRAAAGTRLRATGPGGQMCDLSSGHPSREMCPGSYGSL